jgi:ParB family transcriptional regulator, chromosome partitioning protein
MAKKIFEKAGLITPPGAQTSRSEGTSQPGHEAKPKTAPGAMLQFIGQQSAAVREVEELREKLREFDGAAVVRSIDPEQIRASRWANRHESSYSDQEFLQLKEEIRSAGGNVQPIKVRSLPESDVLNRSTPGAHFELIYGHRRHRACLELGVPVLSLVEEMSDQELFQQMDRENRARKNLSPWEQGCMYRKALDDGLYPSLRKLAESVGVDVSLASRSVALAKLPDAIVQAFPSPNDIQYRWVKDLVDAVQKDPEQVEARAREIALQSPRLSARQVKTLLTASHAEPEEVLNRSTPLPIELKVNGRVVARVTEKQPGHVSVDIDGVFLIQTQKDELIQMLEAFLIKV